jgi:hypothetical protein
LEQRWRAGGAAVSLQDLAQRCAHARARNSRALTIPFSVPGGGAAREGEHRAGEEQGGAHREAGLREKKGGRLIVRPKTGAVSPNADHPITRPPVDAAPDKLSATEACGPHKRLFATPFDLDNLHTVSYM